MISLQQRPSIRGLLWPSTIRRRGQRILDALECSEAELSIVLTDDSEIRDLNRDYRGKDKSTDVLSFPQELPPGMAITGLDNPILGDVVINLQQAKRQAGPRILPRLRGIVGVRRANTWSVLDETSFLLIHGILHLRGYDHMENLEAERMQAKEADLLRIIFAHSPKIASSGLP